MSIFFSALAAAATQKPYKKLAYLQSTGTQYIDTNLIPNSNTKIEIELYEPWNISSESVTGGSKCFFGSEHQVGSEVQNTYSALFVTDTSHTLNLRFGSSSKYGNWRDTDVSKIRIENGVLYVNDISKLSSTDTFTAADYTLSLFARHIGTSYNLNISCKMKSCKIWKDGNTLTMDLIPVLDSNNKPAMYDKIHGAYYYNKGTGEFLYN